MLEHYLTKHNEYYLEEEFDSKTNEYQLVLRKNQQSILIKTFTVGTIIAHTHAPVSWFKNNCKQQHKQIDWNVFLCYDTDSHNRDISQFYEGDWKELRRMINKNSRTKIIDLAASADIEDIMLLDMEGICSFLGILLYPIPSGNKGKSKLKKIFRDNGLCYHEGERAKFLIDHLNKDTIIGKSLIPFSKIEDVCFNELYF
jgi:hypothetical protein